MSDLKTYDVFDMEPLRKCFMHHGEYRFLRRGDCFCRIESQAREIGMVCSGGFGFSRPDANGRDHLLSMAFKGDLIGAYISLRPGRLSAFDVRALCPSEVIVMPLASMISVMEEELPGFRLDFSDAIAYGFMMRAISFRCETAEERYRELLDRIPDVRKLMPMSAIASYLGMTREAFARMRRRIGL